MNVKHLMTPEQRDRISQPMAMNESHGGLVKFPVGTSPHRLTGHFHGVLGLPIAEEPVTPSVTDRLRRAQLLLEEVLETFAAMGLRLEWDGEPMLETTSLTLEHSEGSRYDLVEVADGLADINVIVAGTAVEFGIPLHVVDYEVYSSNLTKLRPDGTPIINGVTEGYRAGDENTGNEPGFRHDQPIGKVLKPSNFVPANIPAVLAAFEGKEF